MISELEAIVAGKWAVSYASSPMRATVLTFEFDGGETVSVALRPEYAEQIARAILELNACGREPDRLN